MPRFGIEDGFHCHLKTLKLLSTAVGIEALALWTIAGSWCVEQLSDGFVPQAKLGQWPFKRRHAALLVSVGLWDAVTGGYQFHEWTQSNETREQRLAYRAKDAGRKHRKRSECPRGTADGTEHECPPGTASGTARGTASGTNGVYARAQISDPILDLRSDKQQSQTHAREEKPPLQLLKMGGATEQEAREVSKCWHRSMQTAGYTAIHGFEQWKRDYETIAQGCSLDADGNPQDAAIARAAVCAWFWIASDGPIGSRRISVRGTTPKLLAKMISRDLLAAKEWWLGLADAERRTLLGGATPGVTG